MENVIIETTPAWVQASQREVAEQLGISQKAVWETEQRALRKLRLAMLADAEWMNVLQAEFGWEFT